MMKLLQAGDKVPAVDLFEKDPGGKVNSGELFGKGKHVIFAVPGAFTPGCSKVSQVRVCIFLSPPLIELKVISPLKFLVNPFLFFF